MALALAEARAAASQGDMPVGALLVSASGKLLSKTANRVERDHNPAAHAEILALAQGGMRVGSPRLCGCVLIVTLEPCLMCAGAIAQSRVDGVVFGAADARAGCLISQADAENLPLAGRMFWHMGGIRALECATLLHDFFARRRVERI